VPNSGRDHFPQLLSRCKLPKVSKPSGVALIGTDPSDKIEFYNHADFRIGCYVTVYSRHFLIIKADEFTKQFYKEVHGLEDKDFAPIIEKEEIIEKFERQPASYNGWGEEEDSLGSFYSLIPRPPRRNYAKHLKYGKTALRFLGKLVSGYPEDADRRFIIEFYLSDDTIRVFEQTMRNSGFVAGKFFDRRRFKNVQTGEWFKSQELIVGEKFTINGFTFDILEADIATQNLLAGGGNYTKASAEEILMGVADSLWDKSFSRTKTFRDIDQDGDNVIYIEEFASLCESLGWKMDEQKKREVFGRFDKDGSGEVSLNEFFEAVEKLKFNRTSISSTGDSRAKQGKSSETQVPPIHE